MIMSPTHGAFNHVVAFEVAKQTLVVHILPGDERHTMANKPTAIRRLLKRQMRRNAMADLGSLLVICEATGGYESRVLEICVELGLVVPRPMGRAYGTSPSIWACLPRPIRSMLACPLRPQDPRSAPLRAANARAGRPQGPEN